MDCIPSAVPSDRYLLVAGTHSGDLHFLDLSGDGKAEVITSLKGGHSDTVRCLHWDGEVKKNIAMYFFVCVIFILFYYFKIVSVKRSKQVG